MVHNNANKAAGFQLSFIKSSLHNYHTFAWYHQIIFDLLEIRVLYVMFMLATVLTISEYFTIAVCLTFMTVWTN